MIYKALSSAFSQNAEHSKSRHTQNPDNLKISGENSEFDEYDE
jgi:hypothetical protein